MIRLLSNYASLTWQRNAGMLDMTPFSFSISFFSFVLFACVTAENAFGMSGREWYQACAEVSISDSTQLRTMPVEKRVQHRACALEARKAWCKVLPVKFHSVYGWGPGSTYFGYKENAFTAMSQDRQFEIHKHAEKQFSAFCPGIYKSESSFFGIGRSLYRGLEKNGGPDFLENWLPASFMLDSFMKENYASCLPLLKKMGVTMISTQECIDRELPGD